MHCKACELNIENEVCKITWVKVNKISQSQNIMEVEIVDEQQLEVIEKVIYDLWYSQKKEVKNTFFDYVIIFLLFVIFWIIGFLLKDNQSLLQLINMNQLNFLMVLFVWFIASVSTCLAITWWIVMWLSRYVSEDTLWKQAKVQISFHIWRIIWYMIWWGILWMVGGYFWAFGKLNIFLLFLAGIFMLYVGLHMLNIIPSLQKIGISMPKFFWKKILNMKNPAFAPVVWALTFFLPCGFTQSMQIYAASTGSFWSWALIMGAFALGTLPVLFTIGLGSSYLKNKDFWYINKVVWVAVVYFWIFILQWMMNLVSFRTPDTTLAMNENTIFEEKTVYHNGLWLENKEVYLNAGHNYNLNIIPTKNGTGCMSSLTIPGIDNKIHSIFQWIRIVIPIVNAPKWKYEIVCSTMWMSQWTLIIQ